MEDTDERKRLETNFFTGMTGMRRFFNLGSIGSVLNCMDFPGIGTGFYGYGYSAFD